VVHHRLPYAGEPVARRHWAYFEHQVQPVPDGTGVEVVGELGQQRRDELGRATAPLFPIAWPKPFGLVMAEALVCGTPVRASRHAVIQHGLTGFVCTDEDKLVEVVGHLSDTIDRRRWRLEAERRCSPATMADGYEQVCDRLTRTRRWADVDEQQGVTPCVAL
jgi:glycosyltransferase involved in cell wall biosynthesis